MKFSILIIAMCFLSVVARAQESPTLVMTDCNFDYDYRLRYYLSPYDIHTTEDLIQQAKDINTNDSQYENKEEKRVIEGSEQTTAQKIGKLNEGEVTRSTHKGGKIYETISPISDEKLSVSF